MSYAEAIGAGSIFIGANAIDYSGYPDCRPEFYNAFIKAANLGIKAGVEGKKIKVITPLIRKTKAQIVRLGIGLGVPYGLTWSCYRGGKPLAANATAVIFGPRGFRRQGLGICLCHCEARSAEAIAFLRLLRFARNDIHLDNYKNDRKDKRDICQYSRGGGFISESGRCLRVSPGAT